MSLQEYLDDQGELRSHATIGGYPLYYVTERQEVLCSYCATKTMKLGDVFIYPPQVNWEDELYCECGTKIESAY